MTLGSLFDGSGGFPLAGTLHGVEPVWASEIEQFPIRVTKNRFPNMKHLGSVTDINGAEIEPVDIITFGSPCQDLSVAGKQAGIHEGQRSSLFFEAIRIIKEMREHDRAIGRAAHDVRPRFAVWENVPGAFSSNKGHDFQAVLQALCEIEGKDISVPMPPKGKWNPAGCIVGNGWSIAWRIYDAQFWGVPQRRKRIYLIADFGSERSGEILFKPESVRGDSSESGETREGAAEDAERSAGGSNRVTILNKHDSQGNQVCDGNGIYPTLKGCGGAGYQQGYLLQHICYPAAFMGGQGAKARSIAYCDDGSTPTLKSAPSGGNTVPDVVYAVEGNVVDREAKQNGMGVRRDQCPTLNSQDKHAVCFQQNQRDEVRDMGEQAGALSAEPGTHQQNYVCFAPTANHCGSFAEAEIGATLQTGYHYGSGGDAAMIVYPIDQHQQDAGFKLIDQGGPVPTLSAKMGTGGNNTPMCLCVGNGQMNQTALADRTGALNCMHDQQAVVYPGVGITSKENASNPAPGDPAPCLSTDSRNYLVQKDKPPRKYIIRRLTPTECARLQGFPDWWCDGANGSDSAQYKLWGNGIALPCAVDVLGRIAKEILSNKEGRA